MLAAKGQKAAAICQSKITEARNASHTTSTNAPRPVETKGANSRRQRIKSVPHEFRFPAPSVMAAIASATIVYFLHCDSFVVSSCIRGMKAFRILSSVFSEAKSRRLRVKDSSSFKGISVNMSPVLENGAFAKIIINYHACVGKKSANSINRKEVSSANTFDRREKNFCFVRIRRSQSKSVFKLKATRRRDKPAWLQTYKTHFARLCVHARRARWMAEEGRDNARTRSYQ